jgi:putative membrane protein
MAVIAAFVIVLVGGLELIDQLKRRAELRVDPEQVLAARFASGEIDESEYSRRLSVLRLGPPLEIPDLPR